MNARGTIKAAKLALIQVDASGIVGQDGKQLNLGLLGSLTDQLCAAAGKSSGLNVVFTGNKDAAQRASTAAESLLKLKEPTAVVSIAHIDVPAGEVAANAANAAGCDALVYLSSVTGVPSGSGVQATYNPSSNDAANGHSQEAYVIANSAWSAAQAGLQVIVASIKETNVISKALAGEVIGTLFSTAALTDVPTPAPTSNVRDMAVRARSASRKLQALPSEARIQMLQRIADALIAAQDQILAENAKDVQEATVALSSIAALEQHVAITIQKKTDEKKIADSLLQRLVLKPAKIQQLADGIRAIARQDEPIGQLIKRMEIAEDLVLDKTTCPIGVLLIIFEARPDALPQIASLAIRSGNGLLLKGGKEAARSNAILHRIIVDAIGSELGPDLISLVTTREEINDLLVLDDVIDLVIPRGGNALVSYIQQNTRIPVLGHADGICHVYVDEQANLDMACQIVVDAKIDYPAACNAVEKVLLHASWLNKPGTGSESGAATLLKALRDAGVTVHGGPRAVQALGLPPAKSSRIEYSSMDVSLEIVDDQQQAIDHIHANGSGHTEAIITDNSAAAAAFLAQTDAACVFHNASTRFSDGFRFGLGAEVGISTSRIHARGPVGVEGLLTTKWILRGKGQIVAKDKGIVYTHKPLPLQ